MGRKKVTVKFQKAQRSPEKLPPPSYEIKKPSGVSIQTEFIDECRANGMTYSEAMELWRNEYCPHIYRVVARKAVGGVITQTLICDCGDVQKIEGTYIPKKFERAEG